VDVVEAHKDFKPSIMHFVVPGIAVSGYFSLVLVSRLWNEKMKFLFHIKTELMHTVIINTTLLTCNYDILQPSKGHLQGVWQIYFNSKVNKMGYKM